MNKKILLGGLGGLLALALVAALALSLWPRADAPRLVGHVPLPAGMLQPRWDDAAAFGASAYRELRFESPLPAPTLRLLVGALLRKQGWQPLEPGDTFYNQQASMTFQHSAGASIFSGPAFVTAFSIVQRGGVSEVTVRSDELSIGMSCK